MFTENWARFYGDWERWLGKFQGKPARGLEIGVYEGRSTVWLCENILTHPESRLTCVDLFREFDGLPADYEGRFYENAARFERQIELKIGFSQDILRTLDYGYQFAIIDGSHKAADVMADAVLAYEILRPGSVMIFDDYEWQGQGHAHCGANDYPKPAIDAFIQIYEPKILHKGYQVIVEK